MAELHTWTDAALIEMWERCKALPWDQKQDIHDELSARVKVAGILKHNGRAYYPTDDDSFKSETERISGIMRGHVINPGMPKRIHRVRLPVRSDWAD